MKKVMLISMSVIILSILFISKITHAQSKADRGPLTKKVFIHYRNPNARPDKPVKPTKPSKDEEGSYTYLSNGLKWRSVEDFIVKPYIAPIGFADAVAAGMNEWEKYVDVEIFGDVILDEDNEYRVDLSTADGDNVFAFDELSDDNIIAVTYVWGYFYGPPKTREIVEADMIFNTAFFWGDAEVDTDVMDVLNIATHELGHVAGMGDLYDTTATRETMYGYSREGDIEKRDLYYGDIAGIQNLYK